MFAHRTKLSLIPLLAVLACGDSSTDTPDASPAMDAGLRVDSGVTSDTGIVPDTGVATDSGVPADTGPSDTGVPPDSGVDPDMGTPDMGPPPSETVIVDFEATPPPSLIGFGGAEDATVVPDPTDATNTVARIVKNASAQVWGGTTVAYCPNESIVALPFSATNTSLTLRVWSPDADIPVRVKVENQNMPTVSVETEARTTSAMAWETITVDFSSQAMGTAALDLAATYDKLSVFFNFGTSGADAGEKIYFLDDITFPGAVFPTTCPGGMTGGGLPLTFDDPSLTYTLTPFGGATAMVVTDPVTMSGNVAQLVKSDTAEPWSGVTMSTGPDESIPVLPITASRTQMTLRVWSPRANIPVRLKIEEALDPTRSVETETMLTQASAWTTLTFDFANEAMGTAMLNPAYNFNQVSVFFDFGTAGPDGGGGTFYFDDLNMAP